MGFYEELSRQYDAIFPADAAEMAFAAGLVGHSRSLLDLGCGTGNKTVHFAVPGRRITGIDLDAGMIEKARRDNAADGVDYRVMDMAAAPQAFAPHSFDAVLCLGNSLVHLDGTPAIGALLAGLHGLLSAGGRLLVQILNYDRILDSGVRELPPLASDTALFTRRYEPDGDRLRFITRLTLKNGPSFENDIPLYPLRRGELTALLGAAGFSGCEDYGNYAGDPYTPESFVLLSLSRA